MPRENNFFDLYHNRSGEGVKPDLLLVTSSITAEGVKNMKMLEAKLVSKKIFTTNENLARLQEARKTDEDLDNFITENGIEIQGLFDSNFLKLKDYLKKNHQSCLFEGGCKFFNRFYAEDKAVFERIFDTLVFGIRLGGKRLGVLTPENTVGRLVTAPTLEVRPSPKIFRKI